MAEGAGGTVLGWGLSTVSTGGLGNPVLATLENISAIGLPLLACLVLVLTAIVALLALGLTLHFLLRRRRPI
ncbi:MAG: hypothetical protein C4332_09225 [Meiothermus sp.]